jgi:hypothetical protein
MPHPLDGPLAKAARARKHFADLVAENGRFIAPAPYGIAWQQDPVTRGVRFHQQVRANPDPVTWGTLIGDCVHNLRAGFDQLAWQLVLANGGTPDWQTEFPVYSGKPEKYETRVAGKVRGMSDAAKALVDVFQPYRDGSAFDRSPLFIVNALDIEDKHHLLVVVGGAGLITNLNISGDYVHIERFRMGNRRVVVPLIDGAEMETRLTMGADTDPTVQYQCQFFVAFDPSGPGYGQPVIDALSRLIGFTETTLEQFRVHFP